MIVEDQSGPVGLTPSAHAELKKLGMISQNEVSEPWTQKVRRAMNDFSRRMLDKSSTVEGVIKPNEINQGTLTSFQELGYILNDFLSVFDNTCRESFQLRETIRDLERSAKYDRVRGTRNESRIMLLEDEIVRAVVEIERLSADNMNTHEESLRLRYLLEETTKHAEQLMKTLDQLRVESSKIKAALVERDDALNAMKKVNADLSERVNNLSERILRTVPRHGEYDLETRQNTPSELQPRKNLEDIKAEQVAPICPPNWSGKVRAGKLTNGKFPIEILNSLGDWVPYAGVDGPLEFDTFGQAVDHAATMNARHGTDK